MQAQEPGLLPLLWGPWVGGGFVCSYLGFLPQPGGVVAGGSLLAQSEGRAALGLRLGLEPHVGCRAT